MSLKLDYSDDAYQAMKELEPKHKRTMEHNLKYQRKREEKQDRGRRERSRKAQESRAKAQQEGKESGVPGNFGDMDAFSALFGDPELKSAMSDPGVLKAFEDVASNPANRKKYENNPKVRKVLDSLMNMFCGATPEGAPPKPNMPGQSCPDLD